MKEAERNLHSCHASEGHVTSIGHNLKWNQFDISAKGRSVKHCKIKETVEELKPTLNNNVSSEQFYLNKFAFFICKFISASVTVIIN